MDTHANVAEERRLYEISYVFSPDTKTEEEHAVQELREMIEKEGGVVQEIQLPKPYRKGLQGSMQIIIPPSLAARIETVIRAPQSLALKRALFVRWGKTTPRLRGRHAFMRKPLLKQQTIPQQNQEEQERRASEIDKQLDELLEKQL